MELARIYHVDLLWESVSFDVHSTNQQLNNHLEKVSQVNELISLRYSPYSTSSRINNIGYYLIIIDFFSTQLTGVFVK